MMVDVKPVIPEVPPRFNTAPEACARVPVPVRSVPAVSVLLFVRVIPVTVTLGMESVPVNAWAATLKVCMPVPALNVPLLVIPPL